ENAVAKLYDITSDLGNSIPTDIGIYFNGEIIFVSSNKGRIHYWDIANEIDYLDSRRIINAPITKIEMLNGRQAIVAGGEDGSLNVLFYSQNNIVKVRPLIGHTNKIVKLYKANLKKNDNKHR
ncbi:MAG: WD40 repeat domain-containing protein, partial [Deltaproteobacteria bacterium TMED58]|nr:WD40 repeat domain-containing protein [Deltaproteobacteria bacterium TMED58]